MYLMLIKCLVGVEVGYCFIALGLFVTLNFLELCYPG